MIRVLSIVVAFCLLHAPAMAQQGTPRIATISVQGEGRIDAPPDHATLNAEVVTKAKTLEAATAAHRERAEKAAALLRGMDRDGLKIERAVFRLEQTRQPAPPGQKQPDAEFQAITSFSLKSTNIAGIDQIVTAIAESGLFEIQNLRFGIEDGNPAVAAARRGAVNDARERAKTYADAAAVHLGEVLEISDNSPGMLREAFAPGAMRASVQVSPPDALTITATITMVWRIVPAPQQ